MAPRSCDTFGGQVLEDEQQGYLPTESQLEEWANKAEFSSVQAQALVCSNDIYPASYRKRLEISKELMASGVQKHNANRKKASAEGQPAVTMIKFFVNPMHLLVQQAYCVDKVSLICICAYILSY